MIIVVSLCIAIILCFVLSYKLIGLDRGLDNNKENVNAVVIGKEPYVTPDIDEKITEQMKTLQQMYIPVQYIDNGLMPKIEKSIKNEAEIEKALKSQKYIGPSAFYNEDYSKSQFEEAKFGDSLKDFEPNEIPKPEKNEIEPFNSFHGLIVSHGQSVDLFDPNSI